MSLSSRSIIRKISKIIRFFLFFFFFSTILVTIVYRFVRPPVTPLQLIRISEQLMAGEKIKSKRKWVPLDQISPNMVRAVIASEDNNFLKHYGIDFDAIRKAREMNKKGKTMRGASTVSQQTAKNVFLWPDRTWLRKGLEVYFTGLIEIFWGKKRIMEVYLNVIEMGEGIYGVEMASETFFHKSAINLNKSEAARIAAVLPNPRRWNAGAPSAYILRRQQSIERAMGRLGKIEFQ
ncbi:MAG: monofunctional biosynthetic peptidoglycan transglycosylase [Lentimicrobiaceae bacterium]|nr:monofunctional biosynthetic peptidoglycan transglycosylase [Lentimicrobiaceae bacterium]